MTYENFIKGLLLGVATREGARHGGIHNMLAVAHVMANRVRAGWSGSDWLQVLEDAPRVAGTIYHGQVKIDPRDVSFRTVLQRIDDVYSGVADDPTSIRKGFDGPKQRALYFCELDNVNNPWFQTAILSAPAAHPRLATIGPVTFFG